MTTETHYEHEPANIKSFSELATRLEAGEVFYFGTTKIHFDRSERCPFRCGLNALQGCWSEYKNLTVKKQVPWYEVEDAFPSLWWVSNDSKQASAGRGELAIVNGTSVCTYSGQITFICTRGNYLYARRANRSEIDILLKYAAE